jgi:hypothetical protein
MYCNEKSRAIIDVEDIERVMEYKWYDSKGYAMTSVKKAKVPLHRFLMNITDPKIIYDHKDRKPLNNRKSNLRIANKKENNRNRSITDKNTSGFVGVNWNKNRQKWRARLKIEGKEVSLGYYINFDDAVKARLDGELKYYGEFAPQANYINN